MSFKTGISGFLIDLGFEGGTTTSIRYGPAVIHFSKEPLGIPKYSNVTPPKKGRYLKIKVGNN